MTRLGIGILAALVLLGACNGSQPQDNTSPPPDTGTQYTIYSQSGGSVSLSHRITLDGATFSGTDLTNNTFSGTAETTAHGFLQLTVTASQLSDVAVGAVYYAFEVPGAVLFLVTRADYDAAMGGYVQYTPGVNQQGLCYLAVTDFNLVAAVSTGFDQGVDGAFGTLSATESSGTLNLSGSAYGLGAEFSTGGSGAPFAAQGLFCLGDRWSSADALVFSSQSGVGLAGVNGVGAFIMLPRDAVAAPDVTTAGKSYAGLVQMPVSDGAGGWAITTSFVTASGQGGTVQVTPYGALANNPPSPGTPSTMTLGQSGAQPPGFFDQSQYDGWPMRLAVAHVDGKLVLAGVYQQTVSGLGTAQDWGFLLLMER